MTLLLWPIKESQGSCSLTSAVSHDGYRGCGRVAGRQLTVTQSDGLQSSPARYQTLDRGLRPGPEPFWVTKNRAEIPTQDRSINDCAGWKTAVFSNMCTI